MQTVSLKLNGRDWQVYLRDEADQSVYNEIFKLREYRSADNAIKTAKHAIIDVGAHAGFFSMYCRALNNKVKIFAVEPEMENLKLLKRHLDENKILGVKVIAGALAGETGERKLFLSSDSHNHFVIPIDASTDEESLSAVISLLPTCPTGRYQSFGRGGSERELPRQRTANHPYRPPWKGGDNNRTLKVKALSFSDFCRQNKIKKISLLKMDIEGGEYELFDGMSDADFAMVNFVILEYHTSSKLLSRLSHKQIEDKLRAAGFGAQVFPSHFDKTMGFIWANNKRAKF